MKGARMQAGVCLAMTMAQAHALGVDAIPNTPRQVGQTDQAQVGLAVEGRTDTLWLTVGGGYTLSCPGGQSIDAQHHRSKSQWPAGFSMTITVPSTGVPTRYPIPAWPQWQAPSTHRCTFQYVGKAKEAIVSLFGVGINISLGGGEASKGDTKVFDVVKPRPAGGPPPPCAPDFNCCFP